MSAPTTRLGSRLTITGFGNIGCIISTYSFLAADAPLYRKGYSICLGFLCLAAASCVAYAAALVWENKKKEKTLREREVALTDEEKKYLGVSSGSLR